MMGWDPPGRLVEGELLTRIPPEQREGLRHCRVLIVDDALVLVVDLLLALCQP